MTRPWGSHFLSFKRPKIGPIFEYLLELILDLSLTASLHNSSMGNIDSQEQTHFIKINKEKEGVNPDTQTKMTVISSNGESFHILADPIDTMFGVNRIVKEIYGLHPVLTKRERFGHAENIESVLRFWHGPNNTWVPLRWSETVLEVNRIVLAYTQEEIY